MRLLRAQGTRVKSPRSPRRGQLPTPLKGCAATSGTTTASSCASGCSTRSTPSSLLRSATADPGPGPRLGRLPFTESPAACPRLQQARTRGYEPLAFRLPPPRGASRFQLGERSCVEVLTDICWRWLHSPGGNVCSQAARVTHAAEPRGMTMKIRNVVAFAVATLMASAVSLPALAADSTSGPSPDWSIGSATKSPTSPATTDSTAVTAGSWACHGNAYVPSIVLDAAKARYLHYSGYSQCGGDFGTNQACVSLESKSTSAFSNWVARTGDTCSAATANLTVSANGTIKCSIVAPSTKYWRSVAYGIAHGGTHSIPVASASSAAISC